MIDTPFTRETVILSRGVIILPTYLPTNNLPLSLPVQKVKMNISPAAAKSLRSAHDDENLGDDRSQGGSSRESSRAMSVTDWSGAESPPDFALFEERHCRCIFKFKNVRNTLVCGNLASDCRREGHSSTTTKGRIGIYKLNVYRKQLNGILDSYMTEDEFNQKEDEERARMRKYTIELGSGIFDATSPVEEVEFKPSVPDVSSSGDADEPFDQKPSFVPKPAPQVSWKPRTPDISIPVPKQQRGGTSTPPSSGNQASLVDKDDLQQVVTAMTDALQKMSHRMSSMEQDSGRLQKDLQFGQAQTNYCPGWIGEGYGGAC